jgi:hypothetical protein
MHRDEQEAVTLEYGSIATMAFYTTGCVLIAWRPASRQLTLHALIIRHFNKLLICSDRSCLRRATRIENDHGRDFVG